MTRPWRGGVSCGPRLGQDMGWLVSLASGYISGDFWIAEAYPFLSMYANPHFPLGLALLLWICLLVFKKKRAHLPLLLVLSLILAIIQPINIVVLALPLVGDLLVRLKTGEICRFPPYRRCHASRWSVSDLPIHLNIRGPRPGGMEPPERDSHPAALGCGDQFLSGILVRYPRRSTGLAIGSTRQANAGFLAGRRSDINLYSIQPPAPLSGGHVRPAGWPGCSNAVFSSGSHPTICLDMAG